MSQEALSADYESDTYSNTQVEQLMEHARASILHRDFDRAYEYVRHAVSLEPKSGKLWYILGRCLYEIANREAAIMAFDRALELSYNTLQLHTRKAVSLMSLNRYDEALEAINAAQAIDKDSVKVLCNKGNIYDILGEDEKALECFKRVLELIPGDPAALYNIARVGDVPDEYLEFYDPDHEVHKNADYSWSNQSYLYYAKAILEAKNKDYDLSFSFYEKANKEIRDNIPFDREELTKRTDNHIKIFDKQLLGRFEQYGLDSCKPIFIVGMPRSGTTLLEQIISSHPQVSAAGEMSYIERIEQQLHKASEQAGSAYPLSLPQFAPDGFKDFGELYIRNVSQHLSVDKPHFTDKMPTNFLSLGLIKLIFPKAKIIHAQRNPLDTCLSCYFIRFSNSKSLAFSFDLEDTGFYYTEYLRLMEHWKELFPGGILDVQYEELIDNLEDRVREVLDYLELEWDEKCLEFYNNSRGVATASRHQVRKPIYKTSSGRWRKYEKHLGPLKAILKL